MRIYGLSLNLYMIESEK